MLRPRVQALRSRLQLPRGTQPLGQGHACDYRHYATLYFVVVVDDTESELGILDLIQVFVETLDRCFENVCELDLIFHSDKVHYVLDEIIMGGMVLETSTQEILLAIDGMNKLEQQSVKTTTKIGPPAQKK
eukprot:EC795789.1.p1 GENE.EC795789.1~~EC795789.1.p1  ORF type:complete len:131 (+),score=50.19 EC795789.1:133-525(+)